VKGVKVVACPIGAHSSRAAAAPDPDYFVWSKLELLNGPDGIVPDLPNAASFTPKMRSSRSVKSEIAKSGMLLYLNSPFLLDCISHWDGEALHLAWAKKEPRLGSLPSVPPPEPSFPHSSQEQ